MKIAIFGPNLNDQSKGQFHAHREGCGDIKRMMQREPEYRHGWVIEAETYDDVGDEIYADHIGEGSMEPGEGTSDVHFFGCTDGLRKRESN